MGEPEGMRLRGEFTRGRARPGAGPSGGPWAPSRRERPPSGSSPPAAALLSAPRLRLCASNPAELALRRLRTLVPPPLAGHGARPRGRRTVQNSLEAGTCGGRSQRRRWRLLGCVLLCSGDGDSLWLALTGLMTEGLMQMMGFHFFEMAMCRVIRGALAKSCFDCCVFLLELARAICLQDSRMIIAKHLYG